MKYDLLIVGCGLTGCVIAERAATLYGKKSLIIDRRNHIGGNIYDYTEEEGLMVQKYGPHAFHTNSEKVWHYLSEFTEWNLYNHRVLAEVEGKKVPVPFNFESIYQLFPPNYASKIESLLLENFEFGKKIPILELRKSNNPDLAFLAEYIYKNIFLGYTMKQWGQKPEEIDESVTARVPVYLSLDDRYFQDKYQGTPKYGFANLIEKMISNELIELRLNTDYFQIKDEIEYDNLIYTGMIDEFFNYEYGKLPYRSLKFDLQKFHQEYFQPVAQVNYPKNYDFTRITEYKYFYEQEHNKTIVAFEYPEQYEEGENEPYYPIPGKENDELYKRYSEKAKNFDKVHFIGRLAEYRYYNMDQVVFSALNYFSNILSKGFETH